jgi:hypothetical protein
LTVEERDWAFQKLREVKAEEKKKHDEAVAKSKASSGRR